MVKEGCKRVSQRSRSSSAAASLPGFADAEEIVADAGGRGSRADMSEVDDRAGAEEIMADGRGGGSRAGVVLEVDDRASLVIGQEDFVREAMVK